MNKELLREYMDYRCSMYFWLKNLYIIEPSASVLIDIMESCKMFGDESELPDKEREFISFFASLDNKKAALLAKDIRPEYARLFLGPKKVLAPPYESVYRSNSKQLFGVSSIEVRRYYQIMGLQINTMGSEPDDFIGFELEFMYYLAFLTIKAIDENRDEELEKLFKYQYEFSKGHISSWIQEFTNDIYENTEMEYFRVLAKFTNEFILTDYEFLTELNKA